MPGFLTRSDGHQPHQPHQALHPLAVDREALGGQPRRHAARPVEGARQILTVDQLHQPEIVCADRSRAAVDRGPADIQQVALAADGQGGMRAVDHRATLGPASLPSLKKSFSTFRWPIWRYSSPTWISLVLSSRSLPFSNTPAAPSSSAFFQAWIWLGWTLNSLASSPTVRSPLSAAKATFALNVALCFCRDCFTDCSCFWAVYRSRTLASPPVSEPGSISHNLIRKAPGKDSLRVRRKVAAWDDDFLASLIAA